MTTKNFAAELSASAVQNKGSDASMSGVSGQDWLLLSRCIGLVGAVALAAAAYLGGALPDGGARPLGNEGPLCLAVWLIGTSLLLIAWWLAGRSAASLRWVFTTAALWILPFALAPPLGSRDVYLYACQGAVYAAGLDPYAVGPATLPCPWLDSVSTVWRYTPSLYGPLFVALAGAAVNFADGHLWFVVAALRLVAVGGVVLTAAYLPGLARTCGVNEARAAWLGLASPLVGVHLIAGAHNDALMMGFAVAGLYYAGRGRPVIAGLWFGLALAVKATAGIALPFAVLLTVGPDRSLRRLITVAGWLALGCSGAYAGVALVTGFGLAWIPTLRQSDHPPRGIKLVVLTAVLGTLWWRARGRDTPETMRYAAWALVATTALAPIFYPWYWLWPLVVIAAADPGARWSVAVTAALAFQLLPDGYRLAADALPSELPVHVGVGLAIWEGWRNRVKFAATRRTVLPKEDV